MSSRLNPYVSPQQNPMTVGDAAAPRTRWKQRAWLAVFLYPVLSAITLYATWLIAWAMLGHVPRPNLDDPNSLGVPMSVIVMATSLAVVLIPATIPLGIVACFIDPVSRTENNWLRIGRRFLIYSLLCVAVWSLLQADPGRVLEWYVD